MQDKQSNLLPFTPCLQCSHLRLHIIGAFQQFGIIKNYAFRFLSESMKHLIQHVVHIDHRYRLVKNGEPTVTFRSTDQQITGRLVVGLNATFQL